MTSGLGGWAAAPLFVVSLYVAGEGLASCFAGAAAEKSPVVSRVERRCCRPFAFVADDKAPLSASDV